ncbi:hypothetical protein G7Y89_g9979 [Cudoniella acicularis]|uniref:Uncharacterized protein n=1 Tax=Cudoniella acicularis TaxID=354080 RepID=A0A8H4RGC4_9HELO|nr:hypothetical protein G7Y89_g9979 [Cudoniella acicularis]
MQATYVKQRADYIGEHMHTERHQNPFGKCCRQGWNYTIGSVLPKFSSLVSTFHTSRVIHFTQQFSPPCTFVRERESVTSLFHNTISEASRDGFKAIYWTAHTQRTPPQAFPISPDPRVANQHLQKADTSSLKEGDFDQPPRCTNMFRARLHNSADLQLGTRLSVVLLHFQGLHKDDLGAATAKQGFMLLPRNACRSFSARSYHLSQQFEIFQDNYIVRTKRLATVGKKKQEDGVNVGQKIKAICRAAELKVKDSVKYLGREISDGGRQIADFACSIAALLRERPIHHKFRHFSDLSRDILITTSLSYLITRIMNRHSDRHHTMGLQDFFNWRSQTAASTAAVTDEEPIADVDEPPDHRSHQQIQPDFYKSTVRNLYERKESLLTRALLKNPENESSKPEIHVTTDLSRRRSMMSNASIASTAELTSDGGLTSPARTNTPSPPPPSATYSSFAPYSLTSKSIPRTAPLVANVDMKDGAQIPELISVSPKAQPAADAAPKRRCITFACGGKNAPSKPAAPVVPAVSEPGPPPANEAPKPRVSTIKFACPGPKASDQAIKSQQQNNSKVKDNASPKKQISRSPSIPRKLPRPILQSSHRESTSTIRRASQSPVAVRVKPRYIIADEKTLQSSEATRFHEFASEEMQEDDWIRRDVDVPRAKLTINDTLKMENAIRQLGNEAEEEALEEDEDEDDEDEAGNYSDDEDDFAEEDDDEEDDDESVDGLEDVSDGNETDNEAGFAESDDESDAEGEFAFWTPGRNIPSTHVGDASTFRPSAHRAASASSIDSVSHIESALGHRVDRKPRRRPIKIRPGTPELPDSTDFVCGTLDEDRPIENAYISCMEARKNAKHKRTPQDIDPSFPTSDPENEEDDHDLVDKANDSDEHVWLHGKFEESDHETHGRRRSTTTRRKSPIISPRRLHSPPPTRRLHSPPPPKQRLRSPPPRKLFGHSPRCMRSPPPARAIRSPAASPTTQTASQAINFAPLASRPGLTHTKSLPRAPNAFGRQYRASRLAAATGNGFDNSDTTDGHVRGAIDIVKGLEQKRQRRKEKFLQKHCNRGRKGHTERKPQPGKGAERMRELGLLMAGKTGAHDPYMLSA